MERFEVPLAAGMSLWERQRDTSACIAGFLTKRNLIESFGLSESQAKEVFKKPMTVRMNIVGSVRYVNDASLMFGLRILGD